MQTSRIKILPEAFCKTSIAAKTEKIASSGANCVRRDLNETLITVVLKAIDGQIKQRKAKKFCCVSKNEPEANTKAAISIALRSPPARAKNG